MAKRTVLGVRLDLADLKLLKDGAKTRGISVSDFARDIIHGYFQTGETTAKATAPELVNGRVKHLAEPAE